MGKTPVLAGLVAALLALAPAPARAATDKTVLGRLAALQAAGAITPEAAAQDAARYRAAVATLPKLTGRRRIELGAVLDNARALARADLLTATRAPITFETVERNRQWWTTGRLLGYGERVEFKGSRLVWQSYPGQGIQLQWLATFGKANALWSTGTFDVGFRALLDEALALATQRADGIAFESLFAFDGGKPPWVSSLSAGTAIQALARGAQRLTEPAYQQAAHAALGIFRAAPPQGVRIPTDAGAHYLQYSFSSRLRIVNGFVQSLNGLSDVATLTGDADAATLLAAGQAQLAVELPQADTGAWSRYSVGGAESDLGYHKLLQEFLAGLCQRTQVAQVCDTATRFATYLTTPPVVAFGPLSKARKGKPATIGLTLSKVSTVTLTVRRDGAVVFQRTLRLAAGKRGFALPPLRKAGSLALDLRAVDLAGNAGTSAATLAVASGA